MVVRMDLRLSGKKYLVTGASRGLGFATAEALVKEGAYVIICGRTEETLKVAAKTLGSKVRFVVADISQHEDIDRLLENIETTEGILDGVFINAGGPPAGTLENLTEDEWEDSFNLVLMSVVRITRGAIPLLLGATSPSILYNTSSSVKQPTKNYILANSLRTSVIGLMRTLADELGPIGIRINAICPGSFNTSPSGKTRIGLDDQNESLQPQTEGIPLKRIGEPHEFGAVSAFLLSPVASYIHGTLLLIDGGKYRGSM
ncbi:MAG: SDR family oxidoreductase [Candidatus Thorarchaeota archaeon]